MVSPLEGSDRPREFPGRFNELVDKVDGKATTGYVDSVALDLEGHVESAKAGSLGFVDHGGDAQFPRPQVDRAVTWRGWVFPVNIRPGDGWAQLPEPTAVVASGTGYVQSPTGSLGLSDGVDVVALVAPDNWENGQTLVCQFSFGSGNRLFRFGTHNARLLMSGSEDGAANASVNSDVTVYTVGAVDGEALWVRCTVDDAADLTRFFYSSDGWEWTQLGPDRDAPPWGFDSTFPLTLGATGNGQGAQMEGQLRYAEVRQLDGTLVAAPDMRGLDPTASEFDDVLGNTFTLNGDADIVLL